MYLFTIPPYSTIFLTVITWSNFVHDLQVCVWLQEDCVKTMKNQLEQVQNIEEGMQGEARTTPLFSTLSLQHMGLLVS